MTEPRRVGWRTKLALLKSKPVNLGIAIALTVMPLFAGSIFMLVISLIEAGYPKVDYNEIDSDGERTTAIIKRIEEQENVTINEDHPTIVSYSYQWSGTEVSDQYRFLDPNAASKFHLGDTIDIKVLNGQSIIVGVEPFTFPVGIIEAVLGTFLIIAALLWGLLYWRLSDTVELYRYGTLKSGKLVSMTARWGSPLTGFGRGVTVHYQYTTSMGRDAGQIIHFRLCYVEWQKGRGCIEVVGNGRR